MTRESVYLTQELFAAPGDESVRPGLARLLRESPFAALDEATADEAIDDEERDAQSARTAQGQQTSFEDEDEDEDESEIDSEDETLSPLSVEQRAWVLALDRSALERLPNAKLRQRYLQEIDWSEVEFPGNVPKHQRATDDTRRHWRLADELFSAMTAVVPERRVPSSIAYHDPTVIEVPGQPRHRLHSEARDAFVRLREAAAADDVQLVVTSSWRSRKKQAALSSAQPNPNAVAKGKSAHMYGLAVDLRMSVPGLQVAEANTRTVEKMANLVRMYRSPVYKWMALRGRAFGWHPYRREPWHWEYNPPGFKARFERGVGTQDEAPPPARAAGGGQFWTFKSKAVPITVGVYAPKGALGASQVDILLFAHGLLNVCGGPASAAGLVQHRPFNLARIIDGAPRPVVLVVPEMNWDRFRGAHPLGRPDVLNAVLAEVLQAISRRQGGAAPSLTSLVLSGHSRAYGFLAPLARAHADPQMAQGALAKLTEVWALDTTYSFNGSHDAASTRAWLDAKPSLRLKIVYRRCSKTEPLALALGAGVHSRLELIEAKPSESHCAVPVLRLPGLLRSIGRAAADSEFEDEAIELEALDEASDEAGFEGLDVESYDEGEGEDESDWTQSENDSEVETATETDSETEDEADVEGFLPHPPIPAARLQPPLDPRLQGAACRAKLKDIGRVAVIGGGLAGLMAARELVRQGIEVSLYEARPFVGGRVFSNRSFAKGRIIEEGAELIGSFHTRWLTLAREFGLAMVSRMEPDLYKREGLGVQVILGGRRLTQDEFDQLDTAMEDRVLKPLARLAKLITHPSQPWLQASLFDGKNIWPLAMLDNMSVKDALPQFCQISKRGTNASDEPLWQMLDWKLVNDEVAPLDAMNFLGLLCKVRAGQGERMSKAWPVNDNAYWDELEIFRCADGCDALATQLAVAIQTKDRYGPKPASVSRLVAVTQINVSALGVTLGLRATDRDGNFKDNIPPIPSRLFSRVILATPPSVWPRVQITVDKKIVDLGKEIGELHMNDAVKHFSKVEKRFWIKSAMAPHGGASRLGQVWEGTDNQTRVHGQDTVLSVFAGPVSDGKRAPKQEDIEKCMAELFPGTPGNPGYASNLIRPTLFSDWPNKAFIKAGYWSPLPGEISTVSKKLTEPLFNGRLFFAGEHADTGFFGYMEGALRSGERAANTLMLSACGLLKQDTPEPLRVAEVDGESADVVQPADESFDENMPDAHEAVPVWEASEEGD